MVILSREVVQAFAPRMTTTSQIAVSSMTLGRSTTTTTRIFSKWDNLVDEDDEPPLSPDMRYVPRNIMRQHENFLNIRQAGGKELTNDVYVREPGSRIFWFSGKVARVSDVSLEDAVARQWPLIEQHAANLRPIELYAHHGVLEIWTAPGDSELEVAYNRPTIQFLKQSREGGTGVKNILVGFQGEMYQPGEEGFRTFRTEDGRPAKPEIQQPEIQEPGDETRAPTDEEMAELENKLEGQDLNALYEEQQQRAGKEVSF
jgi:hypothetical protein